MAPPGIQTPSIMSGTSHRHAGIAPQLMFPNIDKAPKTDFKHNSNIADKQ
jgi:hypothetical protein